MKNFGLLILGALGLAAASKQHQVGNTGLNQQNYQTAIVTDNITGSSGNSLSETVASNILNAPNATDALALGNAALNGLDLTNPASVAVYSQHDSTPPGLNAYSAVATVKSVASYNQPTNPYNNGGGQYPRSVGGITVTDPNMNERLRIAWDNSHQGFTH